ncbi:hypothetical protein GSI_04406 [Ganoderma sinense ZZ0214-1]|uniref:Uncharacterized protein n=1 Tax=Ganoderma sinense ZZ0214-1 TaxID=1077348 RepID=A0A2G8SJ48_9APHY|nr:hypothetical protein GSI_04406 [Ganoderma sinense ZZ0214-1]
MAQAAKQTMPVRGEKTCPKFDEADPTSLHRYFDDLEALFVRHSMPDADQDDWKVRKELAVRYPPAAVEYGWKSLPEFTEVTKNYTDFQDAVYALYPGVTKDRDISTT